MSQVYVNFCSDLWIGDKLLSWRQLSNYCQIVRHSFNVVFLHLPWLKCQ
uniref:Uncharacterized protein n=1 Tax=Lepeophtheirus salmonis TaxID=72036 RepID=A0A0K2V649_LEPSM